jgi:hypothetical protein
MNAMDHHHVGYLSWTMWDQGSAEHPSVAIFMSVI